MPIPGVTSFHFVKPSESAYITKRYSLEVVTLDVEEERDTGNALISKLMRVTNPHSTLKLEISMLFSWRNTSIGILDLFEKFKTKIK